MVVISPPVEQPRYVAPSGLVCDLDRWCKDPRSDLTADTDLWRRLLLLAYIADGDNPDGLFQALHGLRCLGARLERDGERVRIVPGEIDSGDYVEARRRHLVPHAGVLTDLLQRVGEEAS